MNNELKESTGSRLDIRDLVSVIFRRKWLIISTLIIAASAAGFFSWIARDTYEAQMKILVRNMRSEAALTPGFEQATERNEVSQAQLNSEIEILKSRDLLAAVVEKLYLAEPLEKGKRVTEQDVERAILKLEDDLKVSTVKKANIIDVSYAAATPQRAAGVLDLLSELYFEKHLKIHRAPGTFDFFKDQADKSETSLKSAENSLSSFQQRENVVEINRQKELTLAKKIETKAELKSLEGTIKETSKRLTELQTQLAVTGRRIKTQDRVMPNQYSAERLNTLLVELKNRRIALLAKFQPKDRVVVEVDEQIRETSEALSKATASTSVEVASDVNPLWQELNAELSRTKIAQAGRLALRTNLTQQTAQYEAQLSQLERVTPVHDDLSRNVTNKAETYQLYAKKQEEARINDALDKQKISNVSLAEAPTKPKNPNRRNRLLAIVLSLVIGLGVCAGSVFLSEMNRKNFLTPKELESFAGVPVLSTIPNRKLPSKAELFLE